MKKILLLAIVFCFLLCRGICFAEEIPVEFDKISREDFLACVSSDECAATSFSIYDCCGGCSPFPINKEGLELKKKWKEGNCENCNSDEFLCSSLCPMYKCKEANYKVLCTENRCEVCMGKGEIINVPSGNSKYLQNKCCEGLSGTGAFQINELGECDAIKGGPFLTCMSCGDGVCEDTVWENKCNCPKDCQ